MKRKVIDNLRRVKDRIAAAAQRSGRQPDDILMVAVTKTVEIDVIRQLLDAGVKDIGESRVQQLIKRAGMIQEQMQRRAARQPKGRLDPPAIPHWHMIGSLQRNKVKTVLPWVDLIHSLDSLRLAEEISARAEKTGQTVRALLEVNATGDKNKNGVAVGAVTHLLEQIITLPNLQMIGMMTMGPLVEDPEDARPCFHRTGELFEEIHRERIAGPEFEHLSMGMSNDFEVAIEEGATMVRIGSALFEGLPTLAATAT